MIIEPVQGAGGVRAADPAFLRFLREMTSEIGAVLIFDEIIAFRIGPNGAQGVFGVSPDLTTLGKIVGGGYALAAFGGRAEIMDRFDARRPGALSHGGTFNGNPVAAAAGLATLRKLTPDAYDRLAELGGRLRDRLAAALVAGGIDARVDGIASLFQVFVGPALEGEEPPEREPDAVPGPARRRLPPRAARHGRDLDPCDRSRRRRARRCDRHPTGCPFRGARRGRMSR